MWGSLTPNAEHLLADYNEQWPPQPRFPFHIRWDLWHFQVPPQTFIHSSTAGTTDSAKMSSQASGAGPSLGRVSTACARCRRQKLKVSAPPTWGPMALPMISMSRISTANQFLSAMPPNHVLCASAPVWSASPGWSPDRRQDGARRALPPARTAMAPLESPDGLALPQLARRWRGSRLALPRHRRTGPLH